MGYRACKMPGEHSDAMISPMRHTLGHALTPTLHATASVTFGSDFAILHAVPKRFSGALDKRGAKSTISPRALAYLAGDFIDFYFDNLRRGHVASRIL